MTPKTLVARLFDITSLIASNAFTACAAAVIAFDAPATQASKVLFRADELALYALIGVLTYLALAGMVFGFRLFQVQKLRVAAGKNFIPSLKEESSENIADPMLRMKVQQAEIKYIADMQSVCLGVTLTGAGMIAAMYLSNTGITPDGWPANNTAWFAYGAPIAALIITVLAGGWYFVRSQKLVAITQKWICISSRTPKKEDFEPGFIPNTILCRSPKRLERWNQSYYKVIEVSRLHKHLPPKDKREGIVWTLIPE